MAKVYEFLANGFEEIEGLAPVDILRRGGVEIKTVSITGAEWVETSHGVTVKADLKFEDIADFDDADMLLLPGGLIPLRLPHSKLLRRGGNCKGSAARHDVPIPRGEIATPLKGHFQESFSRNHQLREGII